jgi:hypothetical protein
VNDVSFEATHQSHSAAAQQFKSCSLIEQASKGFVCDIGLSGVRWRNGKFGVIPADRPSDVSTAYSCDVENIVGFGFSEQECKTPKREIEYPNFRVSTLPLS